MFSWEYRTQGEWEGCSELLFWVATRLLATFSYEARGLHHSFLPYETHRFASDLFPEERIVLHGPSFSRRAEAISSLILQRGNAYGNGKGQVWFIIIIIIIIIINLERSWMQMFSGTTNRGSPLENHPTAFSPSWYRFILPLIFCLAGKKPREKHTHYFFL